jgi:ribonuclease HI
VSYRKPGKPVKRLKDHYDNQIKQQAKEITNLRMQIRRLYEELNKTNEELEKVQVNMLLHHRQSLVRKNLFQGKRFVFVFKFL